MKQALEKLLCLYRRIFETWDAELPRVTFKDELNYECAKYSIAIFIGVFVWLPYFAIDSRIHLYPELVFYVRAGFSLISAVLCLIRFTTMFRHRPGTILKIFIGYLYLGTALISGASGTSAAPSYIGGFQFIMMLLVIAPVTMAYKLSLASLSLAVFIAAAVISGMDIAHPYVKYSFNDVTTAAILSIVLSYIQDRFKYRSWQHRRELAEATERNEEQLKTITEYAQKADAATQAKSNFLATMSHEIRTPMNAVIGIAQIELRKDNLPEDTLDALTKIYTSGNSLLRIINDILDLSKIEAGKLEIIPAKYDTPSLINDAIQFNAVRIGSKPIEFVTEIDNTMPSALIGDELRIKQVLNNLLSNAIKYTDKGVVKFTVSHEPRGEDTILRFSIHDSGQGLRPEDLETIFSEYQRFNLKTNRATEGTGLGLSITKRLVEMMDGKIDVQSVYGAGSTFTVEVVQKSVPCGSIGPEVTRMLNNHSYVGGKERRKDVRYVMPYGKVLVVDDVETNLYVAKGLLAPYELTVTTAASGYEAIRLIDEGNEYDIIFMDHMMPVMDGIETAMKLRREFGYNGTIIALTANAIAGSGDMFLENGFEDFLSKPIDVRRLDAVLVKFVRGRHPEEAAKYKEYAARDKTLRDVSGAAAPPAVAEKTPVDPKLLEIFRRDAQNAIVTLREVLSSRDFKLCAVTAHAMKSALANVGEHDMSSMALALEKAGINEDIEYVTDNIEKFIETLSEFVKNSAPEETADDDGSEISEDTEYLIEQLRAIKAACDDYDDAAAYRALDMLKKRAWKKETSNTLEDIRDTLFLRSDFESAAAKAHAFANNK